MIQRPERLGGFEFVVLATLRAAQLMRGCIPRIDDRAHKPTVVAQFEVAAGKVVDVRAESRDQPVSSRLSTDRAQSMTEKF